jgi:MFS superfamily sulfate permease-like transporter
MHVHEHLSSVRPLSVLVAALTFAAMWNAKRITKRTPPVLVGLACGVALYYALTLTGFSFALGPVIGRPTARLGPGEVLSLFSSDETGALLTHSAPLVLASALALAAIASIDTLLCAKLASARQPSRGRR